MYTLNLLKIEIYIINMYIPLLSLIIYLYQPSIILLYLLLLVVYLNTMAYVITKNMKSSFDFGYTAIVDPDNKIIKANVYDSNDDDIFVLSYIVCDIPDCLVDTTTVASSPTIIFITGVLCYRFLCYGLEILDSFETGNMGNHILREMADVFEPIYPNAVVRLYSDIDFANMRNIIMNHSLDISTVLMMNADIPANAAIDISKQNLPEWISYMHDNAAITQQLQALFPVDMPTLNNEDIDEGLIRNYPMNLLFTTSRHLGIIV